MRKKTHKEFIDQMKNINPNIEIIGSYEGINIKIECRCKIDGCMWHSTPDNLLRGKSCPKCAGVKKKTHEEFINELKEKRPTIEVVGKYEGNKKKIRCRCLICGGEWEPIPNALLRGTGCPNCFGNKKKNHKEFVGQMKVLNPDIEIVGKYSGALTKIKCKCAICGNEWETRPSVLLASYGCPRCTISKGEDKIEKYLKDNKIFHISQKKFDDLIGVGGRCLSYDFYIQNQNLLIEFNGIQHEKPVGYFGGNKVFITQMEHDKRKRIYAKEHNIDLLEIWYYDYDNIEQILSEKLHINNTEKSA